MNTSTELDLPADIQSALNANEAARRRFVTLPPSHQREYLKHVEEAKKPETRLRRIESMLTRLAI